MTPEELCAALECVHLDIPWDPELVRVWSLACVMRRDPEELARQMGVDPAAARAAWDRLADLTAQRLRRLRPSAGDTTWEVVLDHEDDAIQEPRAFGSSCEAVAAAFEAGWRSGALRAVIMERDAAGVLRSTRELRFA